MPDHQTTTTDLGTNLDFEVESAFAMFETMPHSVGRGGDVGGLRGDQGHAWRCLA